MRTVGSRASLTESEALSVPYVPVVIHDNMRNNEIVLAAPDFMYLMLLNW